MESVPPPARYLGMTATQAAAVLIAVTTCFRLCYAAWLPMLPDETYYLQWSRHLDASYFSKGPAVAYTIWAGTHLFGPGPLGIRFFAVMLSAGTAWQAFLLARRCYDELAGLVAVLLAGVIPLYAVGAVLMTIDPLSAFFWMWAANGFVRALDDDRAWSWAMTGFAVGSGFLAKYINALELLAFATFLAVVPARRRLLSARGFWLMLGSALVCALPVIWWNVQHHWASATQLGDRGHMHDGFQLRFSTLLDFLASQALVVSPLLFLLLLGVAWRGIDRWRSNVRQHEANVFLLLLFLSVFAFYAALGLHMRCEPNWPAVSYLSLLVMLGGLTRMLLNSRGGRILLSAAFLFGWLETAVLHSTAALPFPAHADPLSRTAGWAELAGTLQAARLQTGADVLVADGYKEASILSFYLPDHAFVYVRRHNPPANQFDFWPSFSVEDHPRAIWVTDDVPPEAAVYHFEKIRFLERIQVFYRGAPLRAYRLYLCEDPRLTPRSAAP